MASAMHAKMLRVHDHGRVQLQAPVLRHSTLPRCRSALRGGNVMISAVRHEVGPPDQVPQLARAVAAVALLLPAALPAGALAAMAEAGQAPPPQRWLTLAVLLGACGLAAAQQLAVTNKAAPAPDTAVEVPTTAVAASQLPAAATVEPAAAAMAATQQAPAAAEPVADSPVTQEPAALPATSAFAQSDDMAAVSAVPAATPAPAALPVTKPVIAEAPAAPGPITAAPPPSPLPQSPTAAEPVLMASTDAMPAPLIHKETSSSSVTGRSLASGSNPQGLQLAASAMPVAAASEPEQASAPEVRKAAELKTPVLQQNVGKGRIVLAFLTAPLQWPVRLVAALWAWIQSLAGRRSWPAAA